MEKIMEATGGFRALRGKDRHDYRVSYRCRRDYESSRENFIG